MDTPKPILVDRMAHFAEYAAATRSDSPLYGRLLAGCAKDPAILALVERSRPGQPAALLLLAAVHYLLLAGDGSRTPLARFYPSVTGEPTPGDDPYPAFRAFCLAHWEAIGDLITSRRVQTNEVGRCACLLPAFAFVSTQAGGRPLALVDVGTSAGLTLLWDRYAYDYGDGTLQGDPASPVRLTCELRGPGRPPLPRSLPAVITRVGLDLYPIDVRDTDAVLWLRALIWPEHLDRAETLQRAVEVARTTPPQVLAGDALDVLPDVLATLPQEVVACIVHSHTIYQFTPDARERLVSILKAHAAGRDIIMIGMEPGAAGCSDLDLVRFHAGSAVRRRLAQCGYHGTWLAWDPAAAMPFRT
jgi:hypothetical protein